MKIKRKRKRRRNPVVNLSQKCILSIWMITSLGAMSMIICWIHFTRLVSQYFRSFFSSLLFFLFFSLWLDSFSCVSFLLVFLCVILDMNGLCLCIFFKYYRHRWINFYNSWCAYQFNSSFFFSDTTKFINTFYLEYHRHEEESCIETVKSINLYLRLILQERDKNRCKYLDDVSNKMNEGVRCENICELCLGHYQTRWFRLDEWKGKTNTKEEKKQFINFLFHRLDGFSWMEWVCGY